MRVICIFRICDSRNINLSPFCNLSSKETPQKWGGEVIASYEDPETHEYVKVMKDPIRSVYPTEEMRNQELISSLAKVMFYPC